MTRPCLLALLLLSLLQALGLHPTAQAQAPADLPTSQALRRIRALGRQPNQTGVAPLIGALQAGLPDRVTDAALAALGAQGGQQAAEVLRSFTSHRRSSARLAAYTALADNFAPRLRRSALEAGLGDGDPRVRSHCATLLATHGTAASVPRLLSAFDAGLDASAVAIGQLATSTQLEVFITRFSKQPLAVMLAGLEPALTRRDVPPATKLSLVTAVQDLGTASAASFLQQLLLSHDWSHAPAVRTALVSALAALPATSTTGAVQ